MHVGIFMFGWKGFEPSGKTSNPLDCHNLELEQSRDTLFHKHALESYTSCTRGKIIPRVKTSNIWALQNKAVCYFHFCTSPSLGVIWNTYKPIKKINKWKLMSLFFCVFLTGSKASVKSNSGLRSVCGKNCFILWSQIIVDL